MNFKLLALAAVAVLVTGCGTTKLSDEPIRNQKLSTTFVNESIKLETDCKWYTLNKSECNIVSIESVGVATTNGNTESNRRTALIRAGDRARAAVRHFIQEDVSSSRVSQTIAKNVEKANDRIKSKIDGADSVSMSDDEASKDTNWAIRENANNTAYHLTETIRVNASGILKGFKVVKQEMVGPQEVAVTIRWDLESERMSDQLRRKFDSK
jgi:hypothetical protein